MNQELREEFSVLRYCAGDALEFIFANGVRHQGSAKANAGALPGLSKLVALQEKKCGNERSHYYYGSEDPLMVKCHTVSDTHEQWCAHSQTACGLAKNAVNSILQQRTRIRIRRYGEALVHLAESSEKDDADETSNTLTNDSTLPSPIQNSCDTTEHSLRTSGEPEESDDEDESIQLYLLQHPGFDTETATSWLQRRYVHCCDLVNVQPSVVVTQRLFQCVQPCTTGTVGSFFAEQKMSSPLSAMLVQQARLTSPESRNWMVFPEMMVLLRERCAIPYEVNPDFHGCVEIGKQALHFVAIMGLLEGCRNTATSLNFSDAALTDREVHVLCLFCHAHLRRLKTLDLSRNPGVTDRVLARLRKLAASLPLLARISVQDTSLTLTATRTIDRILYRKML